MNKDFALNVLTDLIKNKLGWAHLYLPDGTEATVRKNARRALQQEALATLRKMTSDDTSGGVLVGDEPEGTISGRLVLNKPNVVQLSRKDRDALKKFSTLGGRAGAVKP